MNEKLYSTASVYVRGSKIDKDTQTHLRDVKNHIVRQYQLDEFGRAIEIGMPELAIKNVQTDAIEEFAEEKTEEDAKEEGDESVEKRSTEKSMLDELQETFRKAQSSRKKETSISDHKMAKELSAEDNI